MKNRQHHKNEERKKRTSKMSMQRIRRDPSVESHFNMGGDAYAEQCVYVFVNVQYAPTKCVTL